MPLNRRDLLKTASAAALIPNLKAAADEFAIEVSTVSPKTVRITFHPIKDGQPVPVPDDGSLVRQSWGQPIAKLGPKSAARTIKSGDLRLQFKPDPLTFAVEGVQQLKIDPATGALTFLTGDAPLLGFGEGGPQFDRRGDNDPMRSGQGGYRLGTNGGRVPIPWLIGTSGWAIFIHQPAGAWDLSGPEAKFTRAVPVAPRGSTAPPPPAEPAALDIFLSVAKEPATLIREYTRITGLPELPALWTFGYQQSHRTLASREEVLDEAKTFREKNLPCDTLIYLGTGFCPSGWNTDNGKFDFNQKVFPDPKAMFDQLHSEHFKVVLHVAYPTGIREMRGTVKDPCDPAVRAERQPSCYWKMHEPDFALGVDGWWPDEGDALDGPSRLVRNRMYWEGPQLDRPNERPFALHRNAYPGMQRYASFLWSGDVSSLWETLKQHVPNAVNTSLSGIPYWGTDIGGFVPTKELTGELYVRWFQFGAFNPLFRSHGRSWKLRLPWGWNTGDPGPVEIQGYRQGATPPESELHNAQVEPICRKYLDLRYRMLPYLYSAVREGTVTGMPIIRALWLHYPDDPVAVARGDEFLWGRDVLVAPVFEQGATERKLYLPKGTWYDYWTSEKIEGGREITKKVDLEIMPLYVRAGAILPLGPVKQYTGEKLDEPLTLAIHPGANGSFLLYQDDGESFRYRQGEWTGIQMDWNDARQTLSLRLAPNSKLLSKQKLLIKVGDKQKEETFEGRPLSIRL